MAWDWVSSVATGTVGVAGILSTLRASSSQSRAQRDMEREARQEVRLEIAYNELLLKVDQVDDWAFQLMYRRWHEPASTDIAEDFASYPGYPALMQKTIGALGVSSVHWSEEIHELVEQVRKQMETLYKAWVGNKLVRGERARHEPASHDPVKLFEAGMQANEAIIDLSFEIRQQVRKELNPARNG